jgi:DNA repair protein RecN (Recombination protein N)
VHRDGHWLLIIDRHKGGPMLEELTIRDFAIIDRLTVQFGAGFNVLTGETGAGKSIIIDAVGALLGGRVTADVVRTGAPTARVEGIFTLDTDLLADAALAAVMEENGLRDGEAAEEALILTREINATGRTTARVNGRAVPVAVLAQIGGALVDIHGQSEHLSLLRISQHVELLDRFSGTMALRAQVAAQVGELRAILREIERLETARRDAARQLDLLNFQVEEITAASLREGEEEELAAERQVLSNAGRLSELAALGHDLLVEAGEREGSSVLDGLGAATRTLTDLARLDPSQQGLVEAVNGAFDAVEELGRALSRYAATVEADPERLAEIEDRLDLLHNLQRKYGATVAEIIAFGEEAARERDELLHAEDRLAELKDEATALRERIGALSTDLSARRYAGSTRLVEGIERELADLNMARARFAVAIMQTAGDDGVPAVVTGSDGATRSGTWAYDERGIDRVEFLISPNPGEELKPLARIASGGEMARLMLALKTMLSTVDRTGTLIFDEVDTGVGGRSGQVVGEKLRYLAEDHQVLCVTHLPQVAALGHDHYRIVKQVTNDRTRTEVHLLDDTERVEELAQMLGGVPVSAAARQAARELLAKGAAAGATR